MRTRAIFVCLTPYHLYTAIGYAEKLREQQVETVLIWKPDFKSEMHIKEYTKDFSRIIEIKNRYKTDKNGIKLLKKVKDTIGFPFNKVENLLKENWEKEILFVFNDLEYWTYRIMKKFKNRGEIILIEEGTALYEDKEVRTKKMQKINEILFGQRVEDYIQYSCGGCKFINTIICQNTNQLPNGKKKGRKVEERQGNEKNVFLTTLQKNMEFQELSRKLKESRNILYLGQNNVEIGIEDSAIIEVLEKLIGELKENEKLIIKPHSRENLKKYDRIKKNIILLDNPEFSWYPVESFISLLHIDKAVAIASSSAINLAEHEKIKVWVLYKILGLDYDSIFAGRGKGNLEIVEK